MIRSGRVRLPPPRSQIRDQRRPRNLVYFCLNPEYIITTTVLAIHPRRSARGLRLSSVLVLVGPGCLSLATPLAIDHPLARSAVTTRPRRDSLAKNFRMQRTLERPLKRRRSRRSSPDYFADGSICAVHGCAVSRVRSSIRSTARLDRGRVRSREFLCA